MTIQDIRRARLAQLIAERYKSQADFVSSTGENQGEVSGLLKTKSFGEKKARKLEVKAGLPVGWLDEPTELRSAGVDDASLPTNGLKHPAPAWMAPEAYRLLTLYYSFDEDQRNEAYRLLALYNSADQDGRTEIMHTAVDFGEAQSTGVIHHKV